MQGYYLPDPTKFQILHHVFSWETKFSPGQHGDEGEQTALPGFMDMLREMVSSNSVAFWSGMRLDDWIDGHSADWNEGIPDMPSKPPFPAIWAETRMLDFSFALAMAGYENEDGTSLYRGVTFRSLDKNTTALVPGHFELIYAEDGVLEEFVVRFLDETEGEAHSKLVTSLIATTLTGFMFSHCKNVEIVEELPPRQIRRAMQRRGEHVVKHHEVSVLQSHNVTRGGTGGSRSDSPSRALHIARGHFATYTEDAPLFGKYTGTFWRPAHVRGKADHGTVHKNYKVKAPKE